MLWGWVMPVKVYKGQPLLNFEWSVTVDGKELDPKPSQKLRNHSPDGFAWGYGGSGPAQLALALLLDALKDEAKAERWYQHFKWEVVAQWDKEKSWEVTSQAIEQWVEVHERLVKAKGESA